MAEAVFSAVAESLEGMATRCTPRGMSFVLDEPPSLAGREGGDSAEFVPGDGATTY